eukprot:TRINITY_DN13922_c0_g1_i1.p1 TRINITY_DN13922_c0_g1~~TRINITY_DN13922_c0_g1_i1.p1  ORF type:complete len:116 (-),score=4.13 TRINITY_DN13922_c0_g1_i1:1056-1403(-)
MEAHVCMYMQQHCSARRTFESSRTIAASSQNPPSQRNACIRWEVSTAALSVLVAVESANKKSHNAQHHEHCCHRCLRRVPPTHFCGCAMTRRKVILLSVVMSLISRYVFVEDAQR